jgi:hypothetical protein
MKLSEMSEQELSVFGMICQKLGTEFVSTEELRSALQEGKKGIDIQAQRQKDYLTEIEKTLSKMEKGGYK